jgi:formate dehydrogenase major subunit
MPAFVPDVEHVLINALSKQLKKNKMHNDRKEIEVVLDGIKVNALVGETILDVADREGIKIPTLCYDPVLKPFAACFLCVVEVKGMKGLQPACSTPVHDGLDITTINERIKKARKTALELILSNHYADCLGPCKLTCPAGVDVQGYISLIEKGLYHDAIALIKERNPLPAICGRVCVRPCELVCRRRLLEKDSGVGIDYLKRFAADKDLESDTYTPSPQPDSGKRVAIIGGGPAGLSAAYWLRLRGHECHIFEAVPQAGGWLRYGIPEYRLPNDILDKEVENITTLGVKVFCNTKLGENLDCNSLVKDFHAIILAVGAQLGTRLGCEGDDAGGVMPGIYFLRDMELTGKRPDLRGKHVVVVGGGNTAMDCCRTAIRCNAESVRVVYRRTEAEMPANAIEVEESRNEGVEYLFLTNPVKVIKDSSGNISELILQRMELGEPDASGRRRPVEIPGSEFSIEADLVLAAIGQKTDLSFLNAINAAVSNGEIKISKWGNIESDQETLQTGIENIFAAGDAVTGPDTIIGAIAQAKKASDSCHRYLTGERVMPDEPIFISRRDNFRPPTLDDLPARFSHRDRITMPLLDPSDRKNFSEVELGIDNEKYIIYEASRCLECGCTAFPGCGLQKYATEYGADQKRFKGDFNALPKDFSDMFVAFDLNKCILCGRCVRICHEVAGADVIDFQHRGFHTIIGTGSGLSLKESGCSSCGLCIETCPTGAITENTPFKPGPVETESFNTVDFIESTGEMMKLSHRSGFYVSATGVRSSFNFEGMIGARARFSYRLLNHERLTKPLIKFGGAFREISFIDAFTIIAEKISATAAHECAIFAGAGLTNEEQYLLRKLAGLVNNSSLDSFHYLNRGKGYTDTSQKSLSFNDLSLSDSFFVFGTDLFKTDQTIGFRIFNCMFRHSIPMTLVSIEENKRMERRATDSIKISSYYHFIKAVNKYIVVNNIYNKVFIDSRCDGFDIYAEELKKEDFETLVKNSGTNRDTVVSFAEKFCRCQRPSIIFAEEDIDLATATEIRNLSLISGKTEKSGSGVICLKECPNSQGIIDLGVGNEKTLSLLKTNKLKTVLIFNEDPIGCAIDHKEGKKLLSGADFMVVQDFFMTETAHQADIVLPSTFIFETGGSFTSTGKSINMTEPGIKGPVEMGGCEQIGAIIGKLGYKQASSPEEIRDEYLSCIPSMPDKLKIVTTSSGHNEQKLFNHGCNSLLRMFDELTSR